MTLTPEKRKAIYAALVAIGAILVVYGLAAPEQVDAWLQVVNALLLVFGAGLAAKNTPTGS